MESKCWDLALGAIMARKLETIAMRQCLHIALGGSVLHSGHSKKDLDIFVYDRNTTSPGNVDAFIDSSKELGIAQWNPVYHKYTMDGKCVCCAITTEGRRIDFFFLCSNKPSFY